MIIYFSSTGNSKYVAKRIAEATHDWSRSITTFEYGSFIETKKDGRLGIVCPTYYFGLPINVEEFLEKIKLYLAPNTYVYFVTTYGGETGHPETFLESILKKKGITLNASFRVKMPENFTPMFDVTDKGAIDKVLEEAEPKIDEIISHIINKDMGCFIESNPPMTSEEAHKEYEIARMTSNFKVTDDCTSCMLCVKRCPSKAITLENGRPKWTKDKCTLCLGCLHRCPNFAIQYGDKTKDHGQYKNPHDLVWEN